MTKFVLAIVFLISNVWPVPKENLPEGFVYLLKIVPDIELELRYFSSDNFVGATIDGYLDNKCIITGQAVRALQDVQKELKSDGYGLKVFDAYRPQQAVDHFVRWAKDIDDAKMKEQFYPNIDKSVLFKEGYISAKSGHTRGSTVDLTIIYLEEHRKGQELDMGTPWDFFSTLSWPASNEVTKEQKSNRMLLQQVMLKHGFKGLKEEWWHFTLIEEPFPNTYFNFPVK